MAQQGHGGQEEPVAPTPSQHAEMTFDDYMANHPRVIDIIGAVMTSNFEDVQTCITQDPESINATDAVSYKSAHKYLYICIYSYYL